MILVALAYSTGIYAEYLDCITAALHIQRTWRNSLAYQDWFYDDELIYVDDECIYPPRLVLANQLKVDAMQFELMVDIGHQPMDALRFAQESWRMQNDLFRVTYSWKISHKSWNKLMHALHGSGTEHVQSQVRFLADRFKLNLAP